MDLETATAIGGGIAGILTAAVTLTIGIGRPLRRLLQQNDEFREDWYGSPARPGRDAVPGVPERLRRIETDSAKRSDIERVETRLDDHLRTHASIT